MAEFYIKGQKALKLLQKDIQMNTVRQGYIFSGEEGIGKKTAARRFAQMVLCTGQNKPCGECQGCRLFNAKSHPDVHITDDIPVKIEKIREINDELFVKPIIADKKIFIIEHAGEMNVASQNAFLKSFEEPPEYAVIILVTNSTDKLLPTILSRGTRVLFSPFTQKEIENYLLEKYSLSGARAQFVAAYSAGIVGRVPEILENEEFFKKRDRMIRALTELSGEKFSILKVLEAFDATGRKMGTDVHTYFDVFISFFRDIQISKVGGRLINSDYKELIEEFSGKIRGSSARRVIEIASDVKSKINNSMKYDIWITNMLINCWEEIHGTGNRS